VAGSGAPVRSVSLSVEASGPPQTSRPRRLAGRVLPLGVGATPKTPCFMSVVSLSQSLLGCRLGVVSLGCGLPFAGSGFIIGVFQVVYGREWGPP